MAKTKKKSNVKAKQSNQNELVRFITCIAVVGLSIIGWFRYGIIGAFLDNIMRILVGQYPPIYYLMFMAVSLIILVDSKSFKRSLRFWSGIILLFITFVLLQFISFGGSGTGLSIINEYMTAIPTIFKDPQVQAYSGLIGAFIYGIFSYLVGREGVIILVVIFALIGIALVFTPQRILEVFKKGSSKTSSSLEAMKLKREEAKNAKALEASKKSLDSMIAKNFEEESIPNPKATFVTLDESKPHSKSSVFMDANFGKPEVDKAVINHEVIDNGAIHNSSETVSVTPKVDAPLTSDFKAYKLPPVTLLEMPKASSKSNANAGSAKQRADRLLQVLKQFGIEATLIDIHIGPAVTKFELKPDSNVKISKISSIQDNLMMELAVKTLRIEAPIPGKAAVGIEIPNIEMVPVKMRDIIQQSPDFQDKKNINVALGKDLMGNPTTISLNKMPHMLIAGATGSGKSVCMNSIITSIILTKTPEELKLLLIDPKKVEFTPYMNIPHLIGPVINDPMQASMALKVVVDEMDNRYDLFSKAGVRNISSFNEKAALFPEENRKPLPWIVVIIDELADLMTVAGKDVETSIQRITQLARAAGIHLIVATQRPSVDVVTGIIKANIPSRIAFAVSSAIDSRTILDTTGAEKLLGYGDMLYIPMGEPNAIRVQGCYVSDEEVRRIAEKASMQAKPHYDDAFIKLDGVEGNHGIVGSNDDPLYEEAVEFVTLEQKASTSLLQRRFKVGYNRAANLIDALEQNGIIGPPNGSKPRDVFRKVELD